MKLFTAREYFKSWSVWVGSLITVTPVLSDNVKWISDALPEQYRQWFITGLGILLLIVRAIKQDNIGK